jgi:hypothetical protein
MIYHQSRVKIDLSEISPRYWFIVKITDTPALSARCRFSLNAAHALCSFSAVWTHAFAVIDWVPAVWTQRILHKQRARFFYSRFKINDAENPRLVLLAPSFSANLLRIASHLIDLRIDLYKWEYLKFGDQKAFRIKPIYVSTQTNNKMQAKKTLKEDEDKEKEQSVEPQEPETASQPETPPKPQKK